MCRVRGAWTNVLKSTNCAFAMWPPLIRIVDSRVVSHVIIFLHRVEMAHPRLRQGRSTNCGDSQSIRHALHYRRCRRPIQKYGRRGRVNCMVMHSMSASNAGGQTDLAPEPSVPEPADHEGQFGAPGRGGVADIVNMRQANQSHRSPLINRLKNVALALVRGMGDFSALALDIIVAMVRWPFAWRELFEQTWFVARVALFPAMALSIPEVVLAVFTFNTLLVEFGAADLSGTGASVTAVTTIGPFVTVLVVAGAGAAAICADLGARTIREELDALRVMGVDPVRALLAPRVLAITVVSWLISSLVTLTGLVGGFFFSVFFQHVTPGAFVAGMTLITGLPDVFVSMVKATVFGLTAGLIGVYLGTTVKGGPAGVGNAVNQTVVLSFVSLFVINLIITAVGFEVAR